MRCSAPLRSMLARSLRWIAVVAAIITLGSARASAQSIDPGMSRDEVVAQLGRPVGERTTGPRTYLFYRNGCEQRCGMHDLVVLESGGVVDAIFRKAGRRYTGESSSPVAVAPRLTGRSGRAAGTTRPAAAAPAPRSEGVALPPGTRRGGIVMGSDTPAADTTATPRRAGRAARGGGARGASGAANDAAKGANGATNGAANGAPAPRVVRGVAGAPAAQPGDAGANAARPRPQSGGDVRVPIVPRDTQLGVQPRERGQRTLPGPVTVPVTPRDTQVARPDSGRRRQPAPVPQPSPSRPDSSTSTSRPR